MLVFNSILPRNNEAFNKAVLNKIDLLLSLMKNPTLEREVKEWSEDSKKDLWEFMEVMVLNQQSIEVKTIIVSGLVKWIKPSPELLTSIQQEIDNLPEEQSSKLQSFYIQIVNNIQP
jgi:hypothetical protein